MNLSVVSTEKTYDSNDFNSDDDDFEGNRFAVTGSEMTEQVYLSTNLITEEVKSVADIFLNYYSSLDITKMKSNLAKKVRYFVADLPVIDPKQLYKVEKTKGHVDTLVAYDEINNLSTQAEKMYKRYLISDVEEENKQIDQQFHDLRMHMEQVTANHKNSRQKTLRRKKKQQLNFLQRYYQKQFPQYRQKVIDIHQEVKEMCYLHEQEKLPLQVLSKRFKISPFKVRKIIKLSNGSEQQLQEQGNKRPKFKKLHERIRQCIDDFINQKESPITAADVVKYLQEHGFNTVKKFMIQRYLKQVKQMKYKTISHITTRQNDIECKLERQFAASCYIRYLRQGKTIISIDESVIEVTDHRKKGWIMKGKRLIKSDQQRLRSISIIGAAFSSGQFYFTLNQGKNNSETFTLFLMKLIKQLDSENSYWRSTTLFLMDNAPYHKSRLCLYTYKQLRLPILFLGPYQFNLSPIENVFSFIKSRNLNVLGTRSSPQQEQQITIYRVHLIRLIKEMCLLLIKLDYSWIERSFYHMLAAALRALCLQDL